MELVVFKLFSKSRGKPYASRTINKTEINYTPIDKEAYLQYFRVKIYHSYLCDKRFKIVTDHKLLIRLFSPVKMVPDTLSTRMLR